MEVSDDEMIEALLANHWEKVDKYSQEEGIPLMQAAEELVEGYVMCGDTEVLKRECLQRREEEMIQPSHDETLPKRREEVEKTNQWQVKVITSEVK